MLDLLGLALVALGLTIWGLADWLTEKRRDKAESAAWEKIAAEHLDRRKWDRLIHGGRR